MGMMQTTQSELELFYAKALPGFLEYIRTHSTDVSQIEIATSLDGITSLPARMTQGGVDKTVLAPLDLLTEGADAATAQCIIVTNQASAARDEANAAAKQVTDAITDITQEKQAALDAASSANNAATKANTAAANADDSRTLIESNESARDSAEKNRQTAETAREQSFQSSKSACDNATVSANNAATSANTAANKANQAASSANAEAQNLTTLKNDCASMASAAESAAQSAEEKIVQMESIMNEFSAESQSSPVRMTLAYLSDISTRNNVAQKIEAYLYPTYGMQNVLYQREEGESLRVNPSGELTVKGTGVTVFYVIPTQNTSLWQEVRITVRKPRMRLTSSGKLRLNGARIRIV